MSVSSLVSCIVPVYNAESTIQRCLDSILNQTYKNIEIIIVDDNSTDSSIKKIYQNSDKRIKIIQHKNNEGPSKSRNDGILTAKGEYICFIDSDDYYSQNFILDLYSMAQDRDADMVMSEIRSIKGNVASILPNAQSTLFTFATKIKALPNGAACNKLYRKKFLLDNNLYFPVDKYWEDSFFYNKSNLLLKLPCYDKKLLL